LEVILNCNGSQGLICRAAAGGGGSDDEDEDKYVRKEY
jgi:hypothetical protein